MLERCEELGIGFLAYVPLHIRRANDQLIAVACRHGATPPQVALAWLLARSPVVCPIPGTSSIEHLEENMQADALDLSEDDLALLG